MLNEKFLEKIICNFETADKKNIKAMLQKIASDRSFFQMVFNAIKEGIIVVGTDRKIQFANRAAKSLIGIPDDFDNINIQLFFRDMDWDAFQNSDNLWAKNIRCDVELLYPIKQVLQFSLVPLQDDNYNSALIILHNVTESRRKTQEIIESEKSNMISLLAAEVAHEIGNPLNSLNIYLQLLKRTLNSEEIDKNEAVELLDIASSEVERLDRIINTFLAAIRSEKPNFENVNLKNIIIETLSLLRYEIESKQINVKCEWPDSLPLIYGDINQLKQALYNLIKNSIQAMTESGNLNIHCGFDDDFIKLKISDSGVGISHENIHKIFEPFYTTKKSGSGLGMMVVERIIREHGAEIIIDSTPGTGTSITLKFPSQTKKLRLLPSPENNLKKL